MTNLLTKEDLAARWRITVKAMEHRIDRRKCPKITKIGRLLRFRIEDVEAYEQQNTERKPTGLHAVPNGHPPSGPTHPMPGPGTPPPPPGPKPPRQALRRSA